jgi:pimeloyl-ACP methyl ester carboxylesterase
MAYQAVAGARDALRFPPPGRLIDVGGHRLHIHCAGEGGPTVVIEGAGGGASAEWAVVRDAIAEMTQVCNYDRAGYGWSDPSPKPRTSQRIVEELHTLLERAEVPGPYVLVGHSLGGFNVRLFARTYPGDVAGLVLVDSSHGQQLLRIPGEVRMLQRQRRLLGVAGALAPFGVLRLATAAGLGRRVFGFATLPQGARERARALALQSHVTRTLHAELSAVEQSFAQSGDESRPLGDIPLAVLSRSERPADDGASDFYTSPEVQRAWSELQKELATSSTNSRHIIAERSGHYIHLDQPEVVIDATGWVVEQARQR